MYVFLLLSRTPRTATYKTEDKSVVSDRRDRAGIHTPRKGLVTGVYAYGGSAAVSGMSRLAGSRLQHATRWSLSALSAGGRLLVGGANQALCATQRSICPPN